MKSSKYFVVLFCLIFSGCVGEPPTETDPARFDEALDRWRPTGLTDHFPNVIPKSATEVQFSEFPGFLQGGGWIQLRFKIESNETQKIFEDATKTAKQYHDGGHSTTLVNNLTDGLYSTNFYTNTSGTSGDNLFPSEYRVFVYDAEPYNHGGGGNWNHGKSKGVAVSTKSSTVVYWAERW